MRIFLQLAIVVACAAVSSTSSAQAYPSKPIRILVPLAVGSQNDILARMLAQKMTEHWRQPVVVDNRPGGAGAIAGNILVKANPDGYTLMIHSDGHAVSAALYASTLPYDTLRDIARVSQVASFPTILVTAPSLGIKSVKQLIALAKSKPGQLTFGSAGIGGGLHLSGEMFKVAAHINVIHVPYKGAAEPIAETMAGRIQFMFAPPGVALPLIQQGRLLALAVGSAHRSSLLPDLPTVAEAGVPGFGYDLWSGLFAPAGTPKSIVSQLNHEVDRIMNLPDVKMRLASQGIVHRKNQPEEFDRFVRAEIEKLNKVIVIAGIKVDQ